jgi:hypothetical protein
MLEVDEGSLHVDPHRLRPVLLEDRLAVSRTGFNVIKLLFRGKCYNTFCEQKETETER